MLQPAYSEADAGTLLQGDQQQIQDVSLRGGCLAASCVCDAPWFAALSLS
jgi:hypothetical protein